MSIRVLCTDNSLEFVQKEVTDFCMSCSILYQITCPHTSQQNEIVERKHRFLLDIVRTLIVTMNVLKYLWIDAIFCACYLINRMPSSVL